MVNNPRQTSPITQGSDFSRQSAPGRPIKQSVSDFEGSNAKLLMSNQRRRNIPIGAETASRNVALARFANTNNNVGNDWRVKISVPNLSTFRTSPLLAPLVETGNNMVFPIVPTIAVQYLAEYNSIAPVHTNYSYSQYVSSSIGEINISGEFPVQNEEDGRYWIAATHFLRSLTKMFYGDSSNKGAPPPLVKLNGYGDHVFNNVPVVVTSFVSDLPNNVDYIRVPLYTNVVGDYEQQYQMVPTNSILAITVRPTYSRSKISTFSLDKFVNGELSDKGFI